MSAYYNHDLFGENYISIILFPQKGKEGRMERFPALSKKIKYGRVFPITLSIFSFFFLKIKECLECRLGLGLETASSFSADLFLPAEQRLLLGFIPLYPCDQGLGMPTRDSEKALLSMHVSVHRAGLA
jgi:hypothetical protein